MVLLYPCLSAQFCPVAWLLLTVSGICQCLPCPSTFWCVSTWLPPATTTTTSPKSSFSLALSYQTSPGLKLMLARSVICQDSSMCLPVDLILPVFFLSVSECATCKPTLTVRSIVNDLFPARCTTCVLSLLFTVCLANIPF